MSLLLRLSFSIFAGILISLETFAQKTEFKSSIDEGLTIRSIAVAPLIDNVSGIYTKSLSLPIKNIVEQDRQWDVRSWPEESPTSPEELEENPNLVKSLMKKSAAQALLVSRLSKGPRGITLKMNLFAGAEGLLLVQETQHDYEGFDVSDLRRQFELLFQRLKSKIPYSGEILSRKGQVVTINLGSQQGISEDQEITVIQILKLQRHPKFHFIVSSQKEILGRLRVNKVEESLSFANIEMEREENLLKPGMKLMPVEFVRYPNPGKDSTGKVAHDLAEKPESDVIYGDNPREWKPKPTPTFGKIGLLAGIGTYTASNTLVGGIGAVEGTTKLTPSLHVEGEMWLNPRWFIGLDLRQHIFTVSNGYPGSTPGTLSGTSLLTSLQGGYNFLLEENFWGPKFQLLFGYAKFGSTIGTSSPTALTSLSFSGMNIGISGSFPVSEDSPLSLGAKLNHYLSPSVSETPETSGSSSSAKITSFSGFGVYRYDDQMRLKGELIYDLYTASFSGTGTRTGTSSASSASHTLTTIAFGIEYLF